MLRFWHTIALTCNVLVVNHITDVSFFVLAAAYSYICCSHSQIKAQFSKKSTAHDVRVSVPVPPDADSARFKTTSGFCKYEPENSCFVWNIRSFTVRANSLLPVLLLVRTRAPNCHTCTSTRIRMSCASLFRVRVCQCSTDALVCTRTRRAARSRRCARISRCRRRSAWTRSRRRRRSACASSCRTSLSPACKCAT